MLTYPANGCACSHAELASNCLGNHQRHPLTSCGRPSPAKVDATFRGSLYDFQANGGQVLASLSANLTLDVLLAFALPKPASEWKQMRSSWSGMYLTAIPTWLYWLCSVNQLIRKQKVFDLRLWKTLLGERRLYTDVWPALSAQPRWLPWGLLSLFPLQKTLCFEAFLY